jgi:hypothetical protein
MTPVWCVSDAQCSHLRETLDLQRYPEKLSSTFPGHLDEGNLWDSSLILDVK